MNKIKTKRRYIIFYSIISTLISLIVTILYNQNGTTEILNHMPGTATIADYFVENIFLYIILETIFLFVFLIIGKKRREKQSYYFFHGIFHFLCAVSVFFAVCLIPY